jgi:hypothetical protein
VLVPVLRQLFWLHLQLFLLPQCGPAELLSFGPRIAEGQSSVRKMGLPDKANCTAGQAESHGY